MGGNGYLRGHKIEHVNNKWVYSDNKQLTSETHKDRACGNCGNPETEEGHDACLGTLPGLMNACCGHGLKNEAYIQLMDSTSIHGIDALLMINILKKHR